MARKTIEVQAVRERANTMLYVQTSPDARRAVAVLLESVLHATGNYKGFKYHDTEWDESKGALRDGYDDTRRYYF